MEDMRETRSNKRSYVSALRKEGAQQTRLAISRAAFEIFRQRGYRGASMDAIARAAGVAPETIYATFGSKREILHYLLDTAVGGDEEQIPVIDRPEVQRVMHDPDIHRLVHGFSQGISTAMGRAAPVFVILAEAAKTEPILAELQERIWSERTENMRKYVQAIGRLQSLRMEEVQAAETLWALTSPQLFTLMTTVRGWNGEKYAAWLEDAIQRLLIK
jgi:AcrR family transcriptional regulator